MVRVVYHGGLSVLRVDCCPVPSVSLSFGKLQSEARKGERRKFECSV